MKNILVALCGITPAVISEAVYVLAEKGENFIPEELVVITTTEGKAILKKQFFEDGVWQKLLSTPKLKNKNIKFGNSSASIKILPDSTYNADANDVISTENTKSSADFILDTLRQYTENPDTRLFFSLSGGRKTMTALAALCMTLLGRDRDVLFHILVNPPFDSPELQPKFFFPGCSDKYYLHGTPVLVTPDLTFCEIPFVRCRNLFHEQFNRIPGTYTDTVKWANSALSVAESPPTLELNPRKCICKFDETKEMKLNGSQFILYWLLAYRRKYNMAYIEGEHNLLDEYMQFAEKIDYDVMPEKMHILKLPKKNNDDMRKLVSQIRGKIKKMLPPGIDAFCFPNSFGRGKYGIKIPPDMIICPEPTLPSKEKINTHLSSEIKREEIIRMLKRN